MCVAKEYFAYFDHRGVVADKCYYLSVSLKFSRKCYFDYSSIMRSYYKLSPTRNLYVFGQLKRKPLWRPSLFA